MKVTRNVVDDLLPLYYAGEASEDSRALVEEFMRENPDYRREATQQAALADALVTEPPALDPNLERTTLERTRRRNRITTLLVGLAIAGWVIPFIPALDRDGVRWMMVRDNPSLAFAFVFGSTLLTTTHTIVDWQLRRGEKKKGKK